MDIRWWIGNGGICFKKYTNPRKLYLIVESQIDESKKNSIEGFGIAYLEAAFFAIPSIASNVGGTPEAVINDNTGKIITDIKDLYDSIRGLLENDKLRLKLDLISASIRQFYW